MGDGTTGDRAFYTKTGCLYTSNRTTQYQGTRTCYPPAMISAYRKALAGPSNARNAPGCGVGREFRMMNQASSKVNQSLVAKPSPRLHSVISSSEDQILPILSHDTLDVALGVIASARPIGQFYHHQLSSCASPSTTSTPTPEDRSSFGNAIKRSHHSYGHAGKRHQMTLRTVRTEYGAS